MAEVGHFLVKGRVANFGFRGGLEEGNSTSTYLELASDLPQNKGLGPVKKIERKKYIIIYYITMSTLTARQEKTPTLL